MPRSEISEQELNTRAGVDWPSGETTGDSGNGHYFVWGPRKVLVVRNVSAGALNITLTPTAQGFDVFTPANRVISIPANFGIKLIGPLPKVYAHTEDNDRVYVDVTSASILLKVFDIAEGV
jgi:hypothetical protein